MEKNNIEDAYTAFMKFWEQPLDANYIHPKDAEGFKNFENLTPSLFPEPFIGDIKNASVYFFTANPGDGQDDKKYYDDGFLDVLKDNLLQKIKDCPFYYLNSKFSDLEGSQWWYKDEGKQGKGLLAPIVAKLKDDGIPDPISLLSKKICNLEFVPYHSKNAPDLISSGFYLESVKAMRNFVRNYVCKRTDNPLLVVLRSRMDWDSCFDEYIVSGKGNLVNRTPSQRISLRNNNEILDAITKKLLENN